MAAGAAVCEGECMEECLFCGASVSLGAVAEQLVWLDGDGRDSCDAGGSGPHYPGREADLFWRGSATPSTVIDLRGPQPTVLIDAPLDQRTSA